MYGHPINKEELSQTARELLDLLEKYKSKNDAAKNILNRSRNILVRAINREIDNPLPDEFYPEEFFDDKLSGIIDLEVAIAKFDLLINGAKSLEDILRLTGESLKQAELEEIELRNKLK